MRPSTLASTALWSVLAAACVDEPLPDPDPQSRIVVMWDARACGEPHRVVVELEDRLGVPSGRSVPCELGGITLPVRSWGVYEGRIYAWRLGPITAEIRSIIPVRLEIDAPVVYWFVETPR
jgi:hypothetical protein